MILRALPEGMAATSSLVAAITARLAAAHAAAAPTITAVVPPAIDPVSVTTALGLSGHGVQQQAAGATGVAQLGAAGLGVADSSVSYQEGDLLGAAVYGMKI